MLIRMRIGIGFPIRRKPFARRLVSGANLQAISRAIGNSKALRHAVRQVLLSTQVPAKARNTATFPTHFRRAGLNSEKV